ncbi:helix-turn-helix domain-containing protein [Bifidobacterium leontopitheci]|uniref:Transcriptional regulator n=1 Tax=Bifidobacterium leontopitheci TaxID=2650774 RepID=A0A6I1GXN8_9BIFI|nr:helix-turn-helix transcriptional regulator [Bifidobacterium leontopitheci]KAB7791221.1 transcriptional regulator [Bifidobacterium leontopitheci]
MGLKQIRQRRGLTQQRLSDKSGVPQPNISDIETGQRPAEQLWLGTAAKLADALDCDPREFLK